MSSTWSKSSAASRYSSYNKSQPSTTTTPSSSTEFKSQPARSHNKGSSAIVKVKVKNEQNFGSMVKKFMEKKSTHSSSKDNNKRVPLIVPADFIAEDLKKKTLTKNKGSNFTALPRKLFGKGGSSNSNEKQALTEVKANTRTLAMVLRSERELLSLNKDQEDEILKLKSLLEERNKEVDKLKDLCLKQREEIKALKSAILFPDEMNSQLEHILDKQGSELKQAKRVIPTLEKQITSLTGQLQTLTQDIAEVKAAGKYSIRSHFESTSGTPPFDLDEEEAANSLDFSSGDPTTPGSPPDDMLLKDINPCCLTPYYSNSTKKSKEIDVESYQFREDDDDDKYQEMNRQIPHQAAISSGGKKLSRSSDYCQSSKSAGSNSARLIHRRSDESKCTYGTRGMTHKFM